MGLVARDVMERDVIRVSPDDPISHVQRLFVREGIHGAPVIDEVDRLLGVVSTLDLVRGAAKTRDLTDVDPLYLEELLEYSARDWTLPADPATLGEQTVAEVMSEDVVTVSADAPIAEIARTLREKHIHRVIVVDDEDRVCGIISSFDLIALLEKDARA